MGFAAYSVAAILSGLYVLGREKAETSPKTLGVYAVDSSSRIHRLI